MYLLTIVLILITTLGERSFALLQATPRYAINQISRNVLAPTPSPASPWKRDLVLCPEEVGAQPLPCSAPICGGEDPQNKGSCKNKNAGGSNCHCENVASTATPSLSTVTASQSDKTVTGTFILQTLTSYSGLRQSITTTVTTATTSSDGSTGVETAAAVILAGGVAWFLSSLAGDAAVAESALVPPAEADGHDNDSKCPNPDSKCSDCDGKENVCTTGTATGCACDDSQASCPEGADTPFCNDCGGCDGCSAFENGKCKGISNQNNKYKDCDCISGSESLVPLPGGDPSTGQQYAADFAGLPQLTFQSFDEYEATCQNSGLGAPQHDGDGSPSVDSSIKDWCSSVDGQTVTKSPGGIDTAFKMFQIGYYSYWLSANNWYAAPDANHCGDTSKISKDECSQVLTQAMDACDPNSGTSHGGSFPGQCIQYNVTLDTSTDPNSPPWRPLTQANRPQCDMELLSGVQYNFFEGIYPQYCSAFDPSKSKEFHKDLTNKDFKPPSKRWISPRTPPASGNQYDGFIFTLEWAAATDGNTNCLKNCVGAFSSLVQAPCGHSGGEQNGMTMFGSYDVGCGTYRYEIKPPAEECLSTDDASYTSWDVATKAVNDFCDFGAGLGPKKADFSLSQTYHAETPDMIEVIAEFLQDNTLDANQCKKLLTSYMETCITQSGKNNPMKWVHGGTLYHDDIKYTILPISAQERHMPLPTEPNYSCWMWYHGGGNDWDIYGYGWSGADWGQTALYSNILGCGLFWGWKFDYFPKPDDSGNEWHASARSVIGPQMWGCYGGALQAASGNPKGPGACQGH